MSFQFSRPPCAQRGKPAQEGCTNADLLHLAQCPPYRADSIDARGQAKALRFAGRRDDSAAGCGRASCATLWLRVPSCVRLHPKQRVVCLRVSEWRCRSTCMVLGNPTTCAGLPPHPILQSPPTMLAVNPAAPSCGSHLPSTGSWWWHRTCSQRPRSCTSWAVRRRCCRRCWSQLRCRWGSWAGRAGCTLRSCMSPRSGTCTSQQTDHRRRQWGRLLGRSACRQPRGQQQK